jgi:hypothetical protein
VFHLERERDPPDPTRLQHRARAHSDGTVRGYIVVEDATRTTRSLRAGVELACSYYSVRALNSGTMYTYTTQAPTHMNTTIHYISRPQGYACVRAYVPLRQRRASTRCTLAALIICERGGAGARKEKETDFNSPEGPPVPSHRRGCWRPGRSGEAYVRYGVHYASYLQVAFTGAYCTPTHSRVAGAYARTYTTCSAIHIARAVGSIDRDRRGPRTIVDTASSSRYTPHSHSDRAFSAHGPVRTCRAYLSRSIDRARASAAGGPAGPTPETTTCPRSGAHARARARHEPLTLAGRPAGRRASKQQAPLIPSHVRAY